MMGMENFTHLDCGVIQRKKSPGLRGKRNNGAQQHGGGKVNYRFAFISARFRGTSAKGKEPATNVTKLLKGRLANHQGANECLETCLLRRGKPRESKCFDLQRSPGKVLGSDA